LFNVPGEGPCGAQSLPVLGSGDWSGPSSRAVEAMDGSVGDRLDPRLGPVAVTSSIPLTGVPAYTHTNIGTSTTSTPTSNTRNTTLPKLNLSDHDLEENELIIADYEDPPAILEDETTGQTKYIYTANYFKKDAQQMGPPKGLPPKVKNVPEIIQTSNHGHQTQLHSPKLHPTEDTNEAQMMTAQNDSSASESSSTRSEEHTSELQSR